MRHASHVKMDGLRNKSFVLERINWVVSCGFADDHAKQPATYYGFWTFSWTFFLFRSSGCKKFKSRPGGRRLLMFNKLFWHSLVNWWSTSVSFVIKPGTCRCRVRWSWKFPSTSLLYKCYKSSWLLVNKALTIVGARIATLRKLSRGCQKSEWIFWGGMLKSIEVVFAIRVNGMGVQTVQWAARLRCLHPHSYLRR